MDVVFFASARELRDWLDRNYSGTAELWVGFYKKDSGRPSVSYAEALDEALCFGWIDGVRKSVDSAGYTIRFTPRKPRSAWSAVNIRRFQQLAEGGRVHPAGLRAFGKRASENSGYAQRNEAKLDDAFEQRFRADRQAWDFFQAQPLGYRRTAVFWIMDAKRDETRLKRLATLMEDSEKGRRLGPYR